MKNGRQTSILSFDPEQCIKLKIFPVHRFIFILKQVFVVK